VEPNASDLEMMILQKRREASKSAYAHACATHWG
jgi:hypothetical protein